MLEFLDKLNLGFDADAVLLRQTIQINDVPCYLSARLIVNALVYDFIGTSSKFLPKALEPTLGGNFNDETGLTDHTIIIFQIFLFKFIFLYFTLRELSLILLLAYIVYLLICAIGTAVIILLNLYRFNRLIGRFNRILRISRRGYSPQLTFRRLVYRILRWLEGCF